MKLGLTSSVQHRVLAAGQGGYGESRAGPFCKLLLGPSMAGDSMTPVPSSTCEDDQLHCHELRLSHL